MDIAYAAGLFDGEGYVRVNRWEKPGSTHIRYQVIAGIGMTYLPVIEKLREQFGGAIHENHHELRNPNARTQFCWVIGSQTAAGFFRQILPFLIVKRDEVELALQLQGNIDKYCHKFKHRAQSDERDAVRAYREDVAAQIYALKKRTFSPSVSSDPVTITQPAG